jgi:aspartate/tyrosine/aromatic aminotransferase
MSPVCFFVVVVSTGAHNPTGCDPTDEQWGQLLEIIKNKGHLMFFDSAYQGFASGDAEADAKAFRRVVDSGFPVLLAQSFAKNFGKFFGVLSIKY